MRGPSSSSLASPYNFNLGKQRRRYGVCPSPRSGGRAVRSLSLAWIGGTAFVPRRSSFAVRCSSLARASPSENWELQPLGRFGSGRNVISLRVALFLFTVFGLSPTRGPFPSWVGIQTKKGGQLLRSWVPALP